MRNAEAGMTLLEAIVAMAILAGAGTSLVAALDAGIRGEHQARLRENSLLSADRVLAALTLLTRTELDRRLGRHPLGEFVIEVQRPKLTLYRIAVAEARAPEIEMLVTVVYRAEAVAP